MIHIYTGDGKGKTTSAIGLAVRGAGAGMRVLFMQFMKNSDSSEISVLEKIGITVICCNECNKFAFQMNSDELSAVKRSHDKMLNMADSAVKSGSCDMIVFDEFFSAYNANLLNREYAWEIISAGGTEIVLTGRNAPVLFTDTADYVTVMQKIKHPFDSGTVARKGVEY